VKLARAIKTTGISMFVRAAAGLRDTAALRLCRDAAAGVIFSGQNLCRAQSQNCETLRREMAVLFRQRMKSAN
jgi:ABC-type microcin C transport system duplicated ATPase subunit YejF